MAVVTQQDERTFPLQQLAMTQATITDLFQSMIVYKRANCPGWTDESPSDFGVQLLWLFALMVRFAMNHVDRLANNCFIATATDREALRLLCRNIGYPMTEAGAASAVVTFGCEDGHPEFTIPAGTQVGTLETANEDSIVFETAADEVVTVGLAIVDVAVVHGETVSEEVVGSSDGSLSQRFSLKYNSVIWQSESVEVLDGAWESWARVDDFVNSSGTDKHYRIEVSSIGAYEVIFGDGTNGKIPARGVHNIRVTYRVGGGTIGNVGPDTIVELLSSVDYIESVTNAKAASGGTDRETLEHAKAFAPASIRTLDRMVTAEDIETVCRQYRSTTYGGIAQAKVFVIAGFSAQVMVIPASGGSPSVGLKAELLAVLQAGRAACSNIGVVDPIYRTVDIEADVHTLRGFATTKVIANIRNAVAAYLSPTYQDPATSAYPHGFGQDLHLSDIYRAVDAAQGVDFVHIAAPTSDVFVSEFQIADIGNIKLTLRSPDGSVEYYDPMAGGGG